MTAVLVSVEYAMGSETGPDILERLSVAYERAGHELTDFGKHIFPRLVPVFEAEAERQFEAEGRGPNVGHWAALSAKYAAWKATVVPWGILVLTGDLRAALTQSSSPHALRDYSSAQFDYGTQGIEYASYHQLGTARLPVRPPFDFSEDFGRELDAAARAGVREAIRAADFPGGAPEMTS